jgi:hypothetical protein
MSRNKGLNSTYSTNITKSKKSILDMYGISDKLKTNLIKKYMNE